MGYFIFLSEKFLFPVMHLTEALGKDLYETLDIKAKVLKKQENKQVLKRVKRVISRWHKQ